MRIRSLHFQVDIISSLILEKNVKNVDFPILIYSIAPKSGAIQYGGKQVGISELNITVILSSLVGILSPLVSKLRALFVIL